LNPHYQWKNQRVGFTRHAEEWFSDVQAQQQMARRRIEKSSMNSNNANVRAQ
jgi:hypothetical protein